jgi:hypothetical protein
VLGTSFLSILAGCNAAEFSVLMES